MPSLGVETTILAFYAAMVCGLISNTVCRRAQYVLHTNVIARHMTALSVLFFISTVVEFRNPDMTVWKLTLYTTGAYIWFLMAAQGPFMMFMASMKTMIVAYMCRVYAKWLDERATATQESSNLNTPNRDNNDDIKEGGAVAELKWLGKDPDTFRRASDMIASIALIIGVLSFVVFLVEQKIEHKAQFFTKIANYASGRSVYTTPKPLLPFLI